jgi:uncharacterized protein (TIGR02270 family)
VGELGQHDLLPNVIEMLGDRDRSARFWAAWSTVRLGDRSQGRVALERLATQPGERQLDPDAGRELVQNLAPSPDNQRLRIIGAGVIGQTSYVPWLIEQMDDPMFARIAAESFVLITGADFNTEQMEVPSPDGFEDGPSDNPEDEDVVVPEDVALPWPDVASIKAWWAGNRGRFAEPTRWFMGAPMSEAACRTVLNEGFQRQRRLAALHLAVGNPNTVMVNASASARRQLMERAR